MPQELIRAQRYTLGQEATNSLDRKLHHLDSTKLRYHLLEVPLTNRYGSNTIQARPFDSPDPHPHKPPDSNSPALPLPHSPHTDPPSKTAPATPRSTAGPHNPPPSSDRDDKSHTYPDPPPSPSRPPRHTANNYAPPKPPSPPTPDTRHAPQPTLTGHEPPPLHPPESASRQSIYSPTQAAVLDSPGLPRRNAPRHVSTINEGIGWPVLNERLGHRAARRLTWRLASCLRCRLRRPGGRRVRGLSPCGSLRFRLVPLLRIPELRTPVRRALGGSSWIASADPR